MRFSDTPLWWRLLVIAVTMLVLGVLYWGADAVMRGLPEWGKNAVAGVFVFALAVGWVIELRSPNRKRLTAEKLDHARHKRLSFLRRLRNIGRGEGAD